MNCNLSQLGSQLLATWTQLGLNQRISLVLASSVVIGGVIAVMDSFAWAERVRLLRLEVIAANIANSNTTRGLDGRLYQRREVVIGTTLTGGQTAFIRLDPTPGPVVYLPGHPDANADGMVQFPNVDILREMADLIAVSGKPGAPTPPSTRTSQIPANVPLDAQLY
jgi:flagellar basal-body rod protein FlgC